MKSGVFGLVCPETGKIMVVTSSTDIVRALKKYKGDLRKTVGSPDVYRWLCEMREKGFYVGYKTLELCTESEFSEVKRKWIIALRSKGEANLNVNFSK